MTTLSACFGAPAGVLIAIQVAELAPADKVEVFGLISAVSALAGALVTPIGGALSDRTRSRFGKRAPWIVATTLISLLGMAGSGAARSVPMLLIVWSATNVVLSLLQTVLSPLIADRVPVEERGRASAWQGVAWLVGNPLGMALASQFTLSVLTGYLVFGAALAVAALLFVVVAPEPSSLDEPRVPFTLRNLREMYWISPRQHPDFAWAFAARALFHLGYGGPLYFLLYLLQDYVHYDGDPAQGVAVLALVIAVPPLVAGPLTGWLTDRTGRRKPYVMGSTALMCLGAAVPLIWPTWPALIIFVILQGFGFGSYYASDGVLMTLVLPRAEDTGKDMGLFLLSGGAALAVSPFYAALVVSHLGGYPALFTSSMVILTLAALAILPIRAVR
ncbi:MFS transporter [Streptomyces sp. NPDC058297]|uniref:MFS transporter n=1 Tax=Streptomyces sp. NPDC058297 TaxID=3346433 RepID=UPI0036E70F6E